MHVVSICPTPVYSTPDLTLLPMDEQGLRKGLEMIAFPGTLFHVIGGDAILKVTTREYPFPGYIDARCVQPGETPREAILPSVSDIVEKMESRVGLPYVWGGNLVGPDFNGVDCTGLLYEATLGSVPRNTKELRSFGEEVSGNVKPLDIFVYNETDEGWEGHVIIALDERRGIESKYMFDGVRVSFLEERLAQVPFPISHRRWHPALLRKSSEAD